ncbi:hypothetical protein SM033_00309 [Vibrio phage vB_VpaM_sm033]|nr:hypothetical protein SM033_00309 [Vibrio phage vB_VpaM_sm033]
MNISEKSVTEFVTKPVREWSKVEAFLNILDIDVTSVPMVHVETLMLNADASSNIEVMSVALVTSHEEIS